MPFEPWIDATLCLWYGGCTYFGPKLMSRIRCSHGFDSLSIDFCEPCPFRRALARRQYSHISTPHLRLYCRGTPSHSPVVDEFFEHWIRNGISLQHCGSHSGSNGHLLRSRDQSPSLRSRPVLRAALEGRESPFGVTLDGICPWQWSQRCLGRWGSGPGV